MVLIELKTRCNVRRVEDVTMGMKRIYNENVDILLTIFSLPKLQFKFNPKCIVLG
jgi:hypothetical protein